MLKSFLVSIFGQNYSRQIKGNPQMPRIILCWIVLLVVLAGCSCPRSQMCCPLPNPGCKKTPSVLRHVVIFRFKEDASPEKIKEFEQAITALPDKINLIQGLEWGKNVSIEDRSDGFSWCFVMSFKSEDDRDAYLVHPDHKALGPFFSPIIDKILVMDYWAQCE